MKNEGVIAKRYSDVLLKHAVNEGLADCIEADIFKLEACILSNKGAKQLFCNPNVPQSYKENVVKDLLQDIKVSKSFVNFILLLLQNKRLHLISRIMCEYKIALLKHKNITKVKLVSCKPVPKKEIDALSAMLSDKLGSKIEIANQLDSSIIGGIVLYLGYSMLDLSFNSYLKEAKAALLK